MSNLSKLLLVFLFPLWGLGGFAQEKLTKEEKARREKNIQAGNPFAKYGYKAKVATLSKGKYLEFHDLDSIVTIGTSRWHVDNKKIVGDIVIDSLNVDAQPIGDAPGMWMSPDPLSEEFPSYSPYTFCFNNPMKFVDPDGRAPQWIVGTDGKAVTHTTNSDGSIKWSSNATYDTQRIGNAMALTPEGSSQLENWSRSDIKVRLEFCSEAKIETESDGVHYTYGETIQGNLNESDNYGRKVNADGTYGIKEATTTIYEGTIKEAVKEGSGKRLEGLTIDKAIGAIAGHETVHGTNKAEINKDLKAQQKGKVSIDREVKPTQVEKKIIEQSK